MSETWFAVVDQGSTATKAARVAADGRRRGEGVRPVRRLGGERIAHDPEALARDVEKLLEGLLRSGDVAAIGLTCQRSTCLVWDRDSGRPLTPAHSWQDTGETARLEALAAHDARRIVEITGLRPSPHYAASKLARLLEGIERGVERAAAGELVAGTLDAFLVHRLTGRPTTEPGHAGRTLLYDLERGVWHSGLCQLFGVPLAALPELLPSASPRGRYRGVPLTAVAGDQQAALVGHGGWRGGVAAAHFGTGAFVLAATGGTPRRHPGLLSAVLASTASGRRFQLEGSVNSAGSAVDWACRLTGETIERWAARPLEIERLPSILPAFTGAAAPFWNPRARAVAAGLDLGSTGADLVAGVLCGVAMRVLDCVDALRAAGLAPRTLRVSGKLTRLEGLVGLLADVGQLPVERSAEEETGLAGIASLAAAGWEGTEASLETPPAGGDRREPRWSARRADAVRTRWREFTGRALEMAGR